MTPVVGLAGRQAWRVLECGKDGERGGEAGLGRVRPAKPVNILCACGKAWGHSGDIPRTARGFQQALKTLYLVPALAPSTTYSAPTRKLPRLDSASRLCVARPFRLARRDARLSAIKLFSLGGSVGWPLIHQVIVVFPLPGATWRRADSATPSAPDQRRKNQELPPSRRG